MLPNTTERVALNTADNINAWIEQQTLSDIAATASGGQSAINRSLERLDQEWDIERALEANAATASLVGLSLGVFVDRRFLVIPAMVAGFLLQHALQGWCPPLPILRRLGLRTAREIDLERNALKALRGDYQGIADVRDAHDAFTAALA